MLNGLRKEWDLEGFSVCYMAGSMMCGLLSSPAVLQCSEDDWDVSAVASSSRICGAGLKYNQRQKHFTFEFGGQNFTISKTQEANCRISI